MKRALANYVVDTLLAVTFLATGFIGILMGFVITRDEDILWAQSRHEWGYIHFLVSGALVVLVLTHLVLHWDSLKVMSRRHLPRSIYAWLGIVLVLTFIIIYVGSIWTPPGTYAAARRHPTPAAAARPLASLGESIYFRNIGEGRRIVPFTSGPAWLYTQGGSCVDCHGSDGRGGAYATAAAIAGPDIRCSVLTGKVHPPGATAEAVHQAYTDATIRRAITDGLDADGNQLDFAMPRYKMSDAELGAVIAYLKKLSR